MNGRGLVILLVIVGIALTASAVAWLALIYRDARADWVEANQYGASEVEHAPWFRDTHRGLGKLIYDNLIVTFRRREEKLRQRRIRRERRRG